MKEREKIWNELTAQHRRISELEQSEVDKQSLETNIAHFREDFNNLESYIAETIKQTQSRVVDTEKELENLKIRHQNLFELVQKQLPENNRAAGSTVYSMVNGEPVSFDLVGDEYDAIAESNRTIDMTQCAEGVLIRYSGTAAHGWYPEIIYNKERHINLMQRGEYELVTGRWQCHDGGKCPIPKGFKVRVRFGDYTTKTVCTSSPIAAQWSWRREGASYPQNRGIIAFKVISKQRNFDYK